MISRNIACSFGQSAGLHPSAPFALYGLWLLFLSISSLCGDRNAAYIINILGSAMDENPYRAPAAAARRFRRRRIRPLGRIMLTLFACIVAAMVAAIVFGGK